MLEDEWDLFLRINLTGVFLCSQHAARQMSRQGHGGRIICVSSIHVALSEPKAGHYTACKEDLKAFARTLASELAPHNITVSYVRPGAGAAPSNADPCTPEVRQATLARAAIKGIAIPERIEPCCLANADYAT